MMAISAVTHADDSRYWLKLERTEKEMLSRQDVSGTIWGELVNNASNDRLMGCLKAFPNPEYCECLAEQLPVLVSIHQYVAIVTTTKSDLNYGELSNDDRRTVDTVRDARDQCAPRATALSK